MNINQFVYAFAMGAIMCFVVHLTGSILASMIIHFTINATNLIWAKLSLILMDYMSKIDPKYAEQATQTLDTKMLVIACIVIFCVCVLFAPINWLIIRALMKYNKLEHILSSHMTTAEVLKLPVMETPFPDKIVTPSFIMSIGIFLIFSVGVEFILPVFGF
ncbi:MAG: CPBP family intramembrane metalloprotease, partial [Vallitaleaceae bacterium]|nr:CPBP family intramembrane metalloprotease [Vallitaleaceae bacterium]